MALVAGSISDGRVLALIESFLRQDIMKHLERWRPTAGTPQGAVISPLLANLYLHPLDLLMERSGVQMVRYTSRRNDRLFADTHTVMPAKAGIHNFFCCDEGKSRMPTFVGMTVVAPPVGQSFRRLVLRR